MSSYQKHKLHLRSVTHVFCDYLTIQHFRFQMYILRFHLLNLILSNTYYTHYNTVFMCMLL